MTCDSSLDSDGLPGCVLLLPYVRRSCAHLLHCLDTLWRVRDYMAALCCVYAPFVFSPLTLSALSPVPDIWLLALAAIRFLYVLDVGSLCGCGQVTGPLSSVIVQFAHIDVFAPMWCV